MLPVDPPGFPERLVRLQKYLAECGVASRRGAELIIAAGRVAVNDTVVTELGYVVDPVDDRVCLDGKRVQPTDKVYYALNKPRGCLTTRSDPHGRPTVHDLVAGIPYRVFAVGRLDRDTTGLLLFTNDGALKYRLTHPKYHIERTYRAVVEGRPSAQALGKLRDGVDLADGRTAPARVRPVRMDDVSSEIELTLYEGKKNEVRRMCDAVGHPVTELERISMAGLRLGDLPPGQYRPLSANELATLRSAAARHPK